jgi:hypothetical protein
MNYRIAKEEYEVEHQNLDRILIGIKELERKFDEAGMPYTPARDENWKEE